MWALREKQLQPRPAVRDLLDTFAYRFQSVPLRVIDDAPPLRDVVVIGISNPDAPLGDEPLDQLLRLRPPGPRDGPLTVGRPRFGGHRRLTAVGERRVVVNHQEPTIPQGIGRVPVTRHPGSRAFVSYGASMAPLLPFDQGGPPMHRIQPTPRSLTLAKAERASASSGSPLGLPGRVNEHERDTAEKPSVQVSNANPPSAPGPGAARSLPGH